MDNLTEYKIKLPTLPDHLELCGPCVANEDHFVYNLTDSVWEPAHPYQVGILRHVIARRRETLADWANKQRLFQALAEMLDGTRAIKPHLSHIADSRWFMPSGPARSLGDRSSLQAGSDWRLGQPPANLTGKLRLEAGKWVDA